MDWKRQGERLNKKLTQALRLGHVKRIVITDKHNTPVIHFPVLFFVVIFLILPVVVGILLFIFLLSEYHAIIQA